MSYRTYDFLTKKEEVCTDPKKLEPKSNKWEVGIFMAKYSFEFKKKVVMEYLNGEIISYSIAENPSAKI